MCANRMNTTAATFPARRCCPWAPSVIGGKDAEVLVYCRSGSRSKQAAAMLARLGYTNIFEFGGIMTWPYEVTAE